MTKRVIVTGTPARRIEITGKEQRKISPEEFAAAIGAEPMSSEEVYAFLTKGGATMTPDKVAATDYLNGLSVKGLEAIANRLKVEFDDRTEDGLLGTAAWVIRRLAKELGAREQQRAMDAKPVTYGWWLSVNGDDVRLVSEELAIEVTTFGNVYIGISELPHIKTQGDMRRLCFALGCPLSEEQQP